MTITEKDVKDIIECYLEVSKRSKPNKKQNNKKNRECKPDQILNPKTNRCIKRDSQLGKKLVKALNSMPLKNRLALAAKK